MPSFPLPAASTWFSNAMITATLIQANIIDPLNTIGMTSTMRSAKRSTTITLASGDNLVTSWPDGGTTNVGNIGYGGGVFTVTDAGTYAWGATCTANTGSGKLSVRAWVNGTALVDGQVDLILSASVSQYVTAGAPLPPLSAGATVQLDIFAAPAAAGVTLTPAVFWLKRVA